MNTELTPEETVAHFQDWLSRNGDAPCTCGHPLRRHRADFDSCAECDTWEPVHLRCKGFDLDRTVEIAGSAVTAIQAPSEVKQQQGDVAQVAKVLDRYSLVLNRGGNHGIMAGDIFTIGSGDIIDPETGETLGQYGKLRVKVTDVHPKFCVAETYRILMPDDRESQVVINIGDPALPWSR